MPEIERLDRMLAVIAEIIEQHVAETAAEHDPECRPDQKIVDVAPLDQARRAGREPEAITPAGEQPDDIGERVPADGKRADRHPDRIDRRKRERQEGGRRWYKGRSA